MSTLTIAGGIVITGDPRAPVHDEGYVAVRNGLVAAVGSGAPPTEFAQGESIDATGCIVMPGLVNAHTHLCMTLGRSLGSDRNLLGWLGEAQLPFMANMTPEDYVLAAQVGAIENLRAGNSTVCEVFFSTRYGDGADELVVQALADVGLRTVFFRCSNDREFAPGFFESTDDIARRSRSLLRRWAGHDDVRIGVGPIVPWSASDEYWSDTLSLSSAGTQVHLHTAETPEYNELVRAQHGCSNVEFLAKIRALGENVMLNHCVHLSENDRALIAEHGSPVIHDPTSNMLLASGIAPVPQLRADGVVLGLACDGAACNNTQDMFEVMKLAALLQKVATRDAAVLGARDVIGMATHGGATACGLGDSLGRLQTGWIADVIVIDAQGAHLCPIHDPEAAVVYSANAADVRTILVGGRVVVRDGAVTTIDEQAVLARARERARALRREAGF